MIDVMSKLAHSCQETMDEIEQRAHYEDCRSDDEFFEDLDAAGIDEIKWDESLNQDYAQWMYFNLK